MSSRTVLLALAVFITGSALASDFSVLTYNVYLRSPEWVFRNDHDWRTKNIPDFLRGYDAVVLQEAFSDKHRKSIIEALADEYPYHSGKFGEDEFFSYNGGVLVLSRWPISKMDRTFFKDCAGSDCIVKKGVAYAVIEKKGTPFHLFGLHLQAQKEYQQARLAQFPEVRSFIDRQKIPETESVLVAGDFNVDIFSNADDGEYSLLTKTVGLAMHDESLKPTYESSTNQYVEEEGAKERLDFVFFSQRHKLPSRSYNQVRHIRFEGIDLSDHHAVEGQFWFGDDE